MGHAGDEPGSHRINHVRKNDWQAVRDPQKCSNAGTYGSENDVRRQSDQLVCILAIVIWILSRPTNFGVKIVSLDPPQILKGLRKALHPLLGDRVIGGVTLQDAGLSNSIGPLRARGRRRQARATNKTEKLPR